MKLTYNKINQLLPIYGKLMAIDFEDSFEEAAELGSEFVKLEDSVKAFEKVKDGIISKYKIGDNEVPEKIKEKNEKKANEEFKKLLDVEVNIELRKISTKHISQIKIRPLEAVLLKSLDLIEK